ncbi:MAG: relaxase/mobilization nuclease domain-containing protein [Lachnospiraceae bacterium]|nr:relaxase/mobilization nuclease domain-containing protein [Lachnospiraceae bacterium]
MATIKHISSKNANYGAAELYLTFQHDEFTNKPVLDDKGRMVPRDDFRMESILCGDEDFAIACMRANLRYGKNNQRGDVKSHHYIISFDPRDGTENGLTMDKAQQLGADFCREHFPGHQALVCTHPDGHNHSGNIHVHIVINSLRIEDVPFLPYMDRPCDTQAGMKHRCTASALRYLRSEVMEMCQRENLHQIDLLNGSKNRITEREYHARRRGQQELDELNQQIIADGLTPRRTKFETDKDILRGNIRAALLEAKSFEAFQELLEERGISVRESRGRFSYLTAERTKPITARKLGDDFSKEAVLEQINRNAEQALHEKSPVHSTSKAAPIKSAQPHGSPSGLDRIVDMNYAQSKGGGYARWATLHNLKTMSATLIAYQEAGFESPEALDAALAEAHDAMTDARKKVKSFESVIKEKKEFRRQIQIYRKAAPLYEEYKQIKRKSKQEDFYRAHEPDFILRESALRYFKSHGIKKLPALKALNTEIEDLISQENEAYNEYHSAQDHEKELRAIKQNIDHMLSREQTKKPEQTQPSKKKHRYDPEL